MTLRLPVLLGGCAIVLVLASVPFVWNARSPVQAPLASPMHGSFDKRFQPALERVGSTKDLPAVSLDAAKPNAAARAPAGAKDKRHERTAPGR